MIVNISQTFHKKERTAETSTVLFVIFKKAIFYALNTCDVTFFL